MVYANIKKLLEAQTKPITRKLRRIVVHHTATSVPSSIKQAEQIVAAIRKHHKEKERLIDIAYHIVIYNDVLFKGREIQTVGAHAKGHNSDSIGVAVIGNADYFKTEPPQVIRTLIETLKGLCSTFGIEPSQVFFHKQLNDTVCPPFPAAWVLELKKHFPNIGNEKVKSK